MMSKISPPLNMWPPPAEAEWWIRRGGSKFSRDYWLILHPPMTGIWRPTRWLAAVVATVLFGLGTLTAPSNGGMFVVLAFPVGLVGLFGLVEEKAGRITPRATARHHNEEP